MTEQNRNDLGTITEARDDLGTKLEQMEQTDSFTTACIHILHRYSHVVVIAIEQTIIYLGPTDATTSFSKLVLPNHINLFISNIYIACHSQLNMF